MKAMKILGRLGELLFSLAVVSIGMENLIYSGIAGHAAAAVRIVPVIPWLPAIPILACAVGVVFALCGAGLLFRRTRVASSITLGVVMFLCGLAFDGTRHPNVMNPEWRTNLLEPIVIACLAWLGLPAGDIPRWLVRLSCCLIALALIVFGIAHFQVLSFIAGMVPGWIPWHWFWTVFFGVAFIAAGLSFSTGFLQRWAAFAIGLMFALWTLTVHLPPLLAKPSDPEKWSDVFIVTALCGGMWGLLRDPANEIMPGHAGEKR